MSGAGLAELVDGAVLVAVLVAVYLPGHFLGRFPSRKGDGWAEAALLRLCCAAAVATPVLVALAVLGLFEMPVIVGVFGACALITYVLSRGRDGLRASFRWWDLPFFGLVAGAGVLYALDPAEYVVKDRDPGVYAAVAAKLARTGELLSHDPLVGAVASFHEFEQGVKYPGFYILGDNLVAPQFFPGPSAWLGLGNLVGGVWGGLYVVPVFGAFAVGAAFALGKELFGRWAGLLGATLLAANYAQVWWSRHPSSEILTQFFVLVGLWAGARFVRDVGTGTPASGVFASGVLSGALLGGAMLVRVDAFLALAAIPFLIAHDRLPGRPVVRRWVPLAVPLVLLGGAAALYSATAGTRYLALINELHVPWFLPYVLLGTALLAVVLWFTRRRWTAGLARLLEHRGREISTLAALAVVGAALWAYFVLPEPWEGLPESWGGLGDRMANFHAYDAQVAVRMVWFLTPPVAVLGMAGLVLAANRLDRARALFLGAFLAFGFLYVALPNVAPDLPWATRRFVPAVFPGLCLLAGYAVAEAGRALPRVWNIRVGVPCAAALAALALGWTVQAAWPVYGARELEGAVEGLDELNRAIPEAEVVYFDPSAGDHAATLDYLYGRPALVYDREELREELPYLSEAGLLEDAVYVTAGGRRGPYSPGLEAREVGRAEVDVSRLEDGFKEVPREMEEETTRFRVYALEER